MKILPGLRQLKTFNLQLIILCSLFFVLCSASLGLVHAQEAVEIPGPEIKDSSFVQVKDLNIGDVVFVKDEAGELVPKTITKLEYQQEPVEVYNLSVAGEQTFFANDFAVHNKRGDPMAPDCHIVISQQIVADGVSDAIYNPNNGSHQNLGLASKLTTISGKDLFYMGRIPFEMDPLYPLEQVASVCYFGHSNRIPDYSDDNSCGGNPINQPPLSRNLKGQNAGGACGGSGSGRGWYAHPRSISWKWGCPYCTPACEYNTYDQGNFLWLYGGAHVTINPPANNLVYKISFKYKYLSKSDQWSRIVFSRHYATAGDKTYYSALADGVIDGGSGSKTVYLGPASDSLHIISEGATVLLYEIQVTFINISSATGTVDNKVTIINNSIGKASGWTNQGTGSVWLSNVSANGPWTQVVNYSAPDWCWLCGRTDYTRMGYTWNLGSMSGTGARNKTVYAMVEGVVHNQGLVSTCSDTISFTPAPPLTGTIKGNVYQHEWGICSEDGRTDSPDGWRVTCQKGNPNGWPSEVDAIRTGNQYQCKDASGKTEIEQGNPYVIRVYLDGNLVDEGWSLITTAEDSSCKNSPISINHNSTATLGPTFYLWQGASAWFQTKEGDVHAQGGTINSKIFPLNTYFSDADLGDYPGLVSYNVDELPDFGRGSVSAKGWLAEDGFSINYSFDRFYSKLGSPNEDDLGTDKLKDYIVINHPDQSVFYLNGDVKISDKWDDFPANRKAIVLINGKLTIDKEIIVPVGSFLAFIVKNDIEVKGVIGAKPDQPGFSTRDSEIQGVFIADGTFLTNYDNDNSGNQFKGEGIFVANKFELNRDLKESDFNKLYPSILFIARPDLFVNIPEQLKESYFFEQEVAP